MGDGAIELAFLGLEQRHHTRVGERRQGRAAEPEHGTGCEVGIRQIALGQIGAERMHDGDHARRILENPWLDAESEAGGRHKAYAAIRPQPTDDRPQP